MRIGNRQIGDGAKLKALLRLWARQHARLDELNAQGGGKSPRAFERLCFDHDKTGHDVVALLVDSLEDR